MTPATFLDTLQSKGVELFLGPTGDLRYSAPVGVLTDRVRETIARERELIIPLLRAGILPDVKDEAATTSVGSLDHLNDSEYGDLIRATYLAAVADALPKIRVEIGQGKATTDPNRSMLDLVTKGKTLRDENRTGWRDGLEGESIATDIEAIAAWWQNYYRCQFPYAYFPQLIYVKSVSFSQENITQDYRILDNP